MSVYFLVIIVIIIRLVQENIPSGYCLVYYYILRLLFSLMAALDVSYMKKVVRGILMWLKRTYIFSFVNHSLKCFAPFPRSHLS